MQPVKNNPSNPPNSSNPPVTSPRTSNYDLIIIGAGPAGSTLALSLINSGLKILVLDKETFPREVICGDALSGQVLNVLRRMPGDIYPDFLRLEPKVPCYGIRFYSPGTEPLSLSFLPKSRSHEDPPGYICPRMVFDLFLAKRLKKYQNITFLQGTKVDRLIRRDDHVEVTTDAGTFIGSMVTGADGLDSVVRKELSNRALDKSYYCMAVRSYFKGIRGIHEQNFIDLIFLKELLPAYFWIFPEVDGRANVGLGLPFESIQKKRLSLKKVMEEVIASHPLVAPRFRDAEMVEPIKARGLALHRNLKDLSGDRFLLLGDAALLVDPFTGEGVGFAMASAESAAAVIRNAFAKGDFSAKFLADYDHRVQRRMGMEHRTSAAMQRYARNPWMFDFVVKKANKNQAFHDLLSSAFTNDDVRKRLANPMFYLRLLVGW